MYLTTFARQFCRHSFTRLLFRVTSAVDMFQWKIYKIFKGLSNVFGINDHILVVAYDDNGKDHELTLRQVMQTCDCKNLELNEK